MNDIKDKKLSEFMVFYRFQSNSNQYSVLSIVTTLILMYNKYASS